MASAVNLVYFCCPLVLLLCASVTVASGRLCLKNPHFKQAVNIGHLEHIQDAMPLSQHRVLYLKQMKRVSCAAWYEEKKPLEVASLTLEEKEQYDALKKVTDGLDWQNATGQAKKLKLVLGAGLSHFDGWLATDYPLVNLLDPQRMASLFPMDVADAILAEHVFEHFQPWQALRAFQTIFCLLKPGGYVRVAVPDVLHPSKQMKNMVYGAWAVPKQGNGYPGHHMAWDYQTMYAVARLAGLGTHMLEFWDESGTFHQSFWNNTLEAGPISRSADTDRRNKPLQLVYTSLIADIQKSLAMPLD